MLTAGIGVVPRREVVEELGVAEQAAARVVPLDQVVAQDVVLGKRRSRGRLEGIDVVDPLAGETADAEEVHVGVGGGRRVRVDAARGRQERGEPRVRGRRQVEADSRLEHAVPRHDPLLLPRRTAAD